MYPVIRFPSGDIIFSILPIASACTSMFSLSRNAWSFSAEVGRGGLAMGGITTGFTGLGATCFVAMMGIIPDQDLLIATSSLLIKQYHLSLSRLLLILAHNFLP